MSNETGKPVVVACPCCGAEVVWEAKSRYRPFCSERCKLMDLGLWAAERYRVAGAELAPDADEAPGQSGFTDRS